MAQANNSEPITVVYVLSTGRSGSTLLEMLLASARQAWTVGEVQLLPFEIGSQDHQCGCGTPVDRCPFWSPIVADATFERDGVSLTQFRKAHNKGQTWRSGMLMDILLRGRRRPGAGARTYGAINADLFAAVSDRAQAMTGTRPEVIVDASKDPYRLFWLLNSGAMNVKVIHLLRGPHGFVNSSLKGRSFSNPLLRYIEVVRLSLRWCVANLIFALVCWRGATAGDAVRVRYEDLAQSPRETVQAAARDLGLDLDSDPERFRHGENHAISGNQTRHGTAGIKLDEAWRRDLGWPERLIISATSFLPAILMPVRSASRSPTALRG